MTSYPMIRWMVKNGRWASLSVGCLGVLISLFWSFQTQNILAFIEGAVGSVFLGLFLRLMSEIVEVVADALLPR